MQFEYLYVTQAVGTIEIEDIGNFAILITNDTYLEWLMCVKTKYGVTEIITYGPLQVDMDELPCKVNYCYQRLNYNECKLKNIINKYINDSFKQVTQVSIIDIQNVKSKIKDLVGYVWQENL